MNNSTTTPLQNQQSPSRANHVPQPNVTTNNATNNRQGGGGGGATNAVAAPRMFVQTNGVPSGIPFNPIMQSGARPGFYNAPGGQPTFSPSMYTAPQKFYNYYPYMQSPQQQALQVPQQRMQPSSQQNMARIVTPPTQQQRSNFTPHAPIMPSQPIVNTVTAQNMMGLMNMPTPQIMSSPKQVKKMPLPKAKQQPRQQQQPSMIKTSRTQPVCHDFFNYTHNIKINYQSNTIQRHSQAPNMFLFNTNNQPSGFAIHQPPIMEDAEMELFFGEGDEKKGPLFVQENVKPVSINKAQKKAAPRSSNVNANNIAKRGRPKKVNAVAQHASVYNQGKLPAPPQTTVIMPAPPVQPTFAPQQLLNSDSDDSSSSSSSSSYSEFSASSSDSDDSEKMPIATRSMQTSVQSLESGGARRTRTTARARKIVGDGDYEDDPQDGDYRFNDEGSDFDLEEEEEEEEDSEYDDRVRPPKRVTQKVYFQCTLLMTLIRKLPPLLDVL